MTDANDAKWAAVKADYDNGKLPVKVILDRHGISRIQLEQVARIERGSEQVLEISNRASLFI